MFEVVGSEVLRGVEVVQVTAPAALAAALFTMTDDEIAELTMEQAEALVLAAQRVASAATARQRSAMETVVRRCDERAECEVADASAAGARRPGLSGQSAAAGSLGALLHLSPRTMSTRIEQARRLVCALPQVQALAWSGDLEPYRVDAVVVEAAAVPLTGLHEFEARVLEGGIAELSCAALRRRARRAAERCGPEEAEEFAQLARSRSAVRVRPGECAGMTRLVADLPTPVAMRVWGAVDGLAADYARAQPGLLMGVARADALADLIAANATISTVVELVAPIQNQGLASWHRCPPEVGDGRTRGVSSKCLTVGGTTDRTGCEDALSAGAVPSPGRDDHQGRREVAATQGAQDDPGGYDAWGGFAEPAATGSQDDPGDYDEQGGCEELDDGVLHDHGGDLWFVSAHTEVPLLGSLLPADVVDLLTDPDVTIRLSRSDSLTGAIRWQDPHTYRPGARTARAVRSRDGTCRFPGCATTARRCQLDHVVRHPDGPTTVTNLQTLCATHHGFKHHAGWQVSMDDLGVCTWTAPDGRTHTTWPTDRHGYRAA